MKKTRRIAAFIAALAMAATLALPGAMMTAQAESQNVTVKVQTDGTVSNNEGNKPSADVAAHTYTAYEIFTAENNQTAGADTEETSDDEYEFNITGFGSGMDWDALLTAGSAFMNFKPDGKTTIASVIAGLGATATEAEKAAAIAQVLGDISSASPDADTLAGIFAAAKTGTGTEVTTAGIPLTEGYYLVTDAYATAAADALSKFILQVAKKQGSSDITIVPKKSYPTVIKKVKENVNTPNAPVTVNGVEQTVDTTAKYNDVADYDIGSAVPFKLYGTMPATLGDYSAYYYKFTDTLGSEFDQPETITITVGTATLTATWSGTAYTVTGDAAGTTNCRVTWDATDHKLTISFEDIKVYPDVDYTTIVTVEYTAVLNDTAKIGLPGQVNAVKLTYSNNPNFEYHPNTEDEEEDTPTDDNGTPEDKDDDKEQTDETPEDKVIVFTYELDVTKIDGVTKAKLPNAEFTLQNNLNEYAKVDSNGIFLGWVAAEVTDANGTTTLKSDANGLFKVIGIDDGTYTLTEKTPPTGYNPLATPVRFTIDATTANNQSWNNFIASDALTSLKLDNTPQDEGTAAGDRGQAAMDIENNKGTELPSTGGMGTALFVVGGGITAAAAGIYLVSKKRARDEQ